MKRPSCQVHDPKVLCSDFAADPFGFALVVPVLASRAFRSDFRFHLDVSLLEVPREIQAGLHHSN